MPKWKPSWKFFKIVQWVFSAYNYPTEIKFHMYQICLGIGQKYIIEHLIVIGLELVSVIVIAKIQSHFFARFTSFVECIGYALIVVNGLTFAWHGRAN